MLLNYRCIPVGESAMLINFADKIDIRENVLIHKVVKALKKQINIIETITPAYSSILINFNACMITYREINEKVNQILTVFDTSSQDEQVKVIEIPVCYDDEFAIDIKEIAEFGNMSIADLIKLHTRDNYFIYMLGFMPCYPYLGTTPDRIGIPRLETPRGKVPAGSVALAGKQAGIYPVESPGGWHIIGRTPIVLYNPEEPQARYEAGNYLHFYPISKTEFYQIKELDNRGMFQLKERVLGTPFN